MSLVIMWLRCEKDAGCGMLGAGSRRGYLVGPPSLAARTIAILPDTFGVAGATPQNSGDMD